MQKPTIPKGTRDFGPQECAKRQYIIQTIREQFQLFAFDQIETPAMENLSILQGKYGDEGDQLLFKILNSGNYLENVTSEHIKEGISKTTPEIAEKGLRYDLTVPFARFVVMNQHQITFPFKRFQIQPVWRADRPQKGRYREFFQCDADIIGVKNIWNEVELTLLLHAVFKNLHIEDFVLKINHRDVLFSLASLFSLQGKEIPFCVALDKLDKIGTEAVTLELASMGGNMELISNFLELLTAKNTNDEMLKYMTALVGDEHPGLLDLKKYFQELSAQENRVTQKIELDFSLARGLSYYTGMIFETKSTAVKIGSIAGGGRYDNLTGVFGLPNISGVGISFGIDRIYDVMLELNAFPDTLGSKNIVLFTHFDEPSMQYSTRIASRLRDQKISCEVYPEVAKIKKQLTYADKMGIVNVVTIGENEIKTGKLSLKNMKTGELSLVTLDDLILLMKPK